MMVLIAKLENNMLSFAFTSTKHGLLLKFLSYALHSYTTVDSNLKVKVET